MTNSIRVRSSAALAMLALALLFVLRFAASDRVADPCADPEAQAEMLRVSGTATARVARSKPGGARLVNVKGELRDEAGQMTYVMTRSTQVLNFAAETLAGAKMTMAPTREWTEEIDVDGEQVTLAWAEQPFQGGKQIVGHVLFLGNEVNQSPFVWLARTATTQLRHGTIPATLYRAEGAYTSRGSATLQNDETQWLREAIRHHRTTCGRP